MIRTYIFIVLTVLFFSACQNKTDLPELLLLDYPTYYEVFPREMKVKREVERLLGSRFQKSKWKLKNFEQIDSELGSYLEQKEDVTLFFPQFLVPVFLNWESSLTVKNIGLISYGMGKKTGRADLSLFQIITPEEMVFDKLSSEIFATLKGGKETVILTEKNSGLSDRLQQYWKELKDFSNESVKIVELQQNSENKQVQTELTAFLHADLILFAGLQNKIVNTMDQKLLEKRKVIEVFTRYGEINKNVNKFLYVDDAIAVKEGISSQEILPFFDRKKGEKVLIHYVVKNKDVVKIEDSRPVSVLKKWYD